MYEEKLKYVYMVLIGLVVLLLLWWLHRWMCPQQGSGEGLGSKLKSMFSKKPVDSSKKYQN